MQCAQCGTENEESARFCASCGSPIGAATPVVAAAADVTQATPPAVEPAVEPAVAPVAATPPAVEPAVAPLAAPTSAAAPVTSFTPPPPPRKKRGCLITTIALFAALAIASGAIAWFVTRPPRDLGVSYTEADYQSAIQELGMEVTDTVPDLPIEQTKVVYSGRQERSVAKGNPVRLNSKQVSAVISMHHRSPKWAIADCQILLGADNQVQLSGYAIYEGTRYAFYSDLNVLLAGPRTIGGNADKIVVFGVDFPQQWYPVAEQYLLDKTNDWLAGMGEGLDIKSARIENGQLVLEGTFPTSAKRIPLGSVPPTSTPSP